MSDNCKSDQCSTSQECGAAIQTIEGMLRPFKKVGKMAWWWVKWLIKPPRDPTPSKFSNVIMIWISNLTNVTK